MKNKIKLKKAELFMAKLGNTKKLMNLDPDEFENHIRRFTNDQEIIDYIADRFVDVEEVMNDAYTAAEFDYYADMADYEAGSN